MIQQGRCFHLLTTLLILFMALRLSASAHVHAAEKQSSSSAAISSFFVQDDDDGCGDDDDDDCELDQFVPHQVVVKLNAQSSATIEAINATYGTATLKTLLASGGIYLLLTPDTTSISKLLNQMQEDTRLIYAEPNFYGEIPEGGSRGKWAWNGSDPGPIGEQYAIGMLALAEAHRISRGDGRIVAVLDTGVEIKHPALAGRLTASRYDFIDDDPIPDEDFANLDLNSDGYVDESAGHGTHVAGIISQAAPDAQIMPVRVLDATGRGNVFLIAEAILFAAENGAHVINLSLGTTGYSELLAEIINDVVATHNIVVVAAAGNLSSNNPLFPAAQDTVIAVTAIDQNRQRADFANYGKWIDLSAPGESISSAFPVGGYASWSGTSMATPFISGQAALLGSLYPSLGADEIRRCLLATAQPLAPELGAGLADFVASLNTDGNCFYPDPGDVDDIPVIQDSTCTGWLGRVWADSLKVPQDTICTLEETRLKGTIKVERGATLYARGIQIDGNIQAEDAFAVITTDNSTVGGSIQIKKSNLITIEHTTVSGNIQLEANEDGLSILGNQVDGNVQIFKNQGGARIINNVIGGNLQCKENDPLPRIRNNFVNGSTKDQCLERQRRSHSEQLSCDCVYLDETDDGSGQHGSLFLYLPALTNQ